MLVSTVLTLGMLSSNCILLAALPCFFRSRYVRAATLLSISQARKWFPSLRSLKSKSPFADGCRRLLASPRGIKLALRTCRSNSVSFYFTQTFPEKVLVISNQAMFNSFVRRKKQSLPDVRLHVGSSIDRYASGSANRQGPAATRRSLQIATHVDCFRSTPNCNHKQLARLTSFSFVRAGNENRF